MPLPSRPPLSSLAPPSLRPQFVEFQLPFGKPGLFRMSFLTHRAAEG